MIEPFVCGGDVKLPWLLFTFAKKLRCVPYGIGVPCI